MASRPEIASWTGQAGEPAEALRLYQLLLPDRERVFGPHHPDTLATRERIQSLEEDGDADASSS